MKRIALMALASSVALAAAAPASAAIYISVKIDGVEQAPGTASSVDLSSGYYATPALLPYSYNGITVSLDVTGKGFGPLAAPDPQFLTNTTTVEAQGGTGNHTVLITLGQTGLTSGFSAFSATSTLNTQLASLVGNATASAYVNNNNTALATGTLIGGTVSCAGGSLISCSGGGVTGATHPTPFSETVQYAFTINSGRLSASTTINGAVPEPATWGMMLLGFGVVGSAMRRRNAKTIASFA